MGVQFLNKNWNTKDCCWIACWLAVLNYHFWDLNLAEHLEMCCLWPPEEKHYTRRQDEEWQLHKPHPLHSCRLPSHYVGIRGPKHQLIINKYNKMPIFLRQPGTHKLVVVLQLQIWLSESLHLAPKGLHSTKQIELMNGWIPAAPKRALSLRS